VETGIDGAASSACRGFWKVGETFSRNDREIPRQYSPLQSDKEI
jgi:hypothetical protein